MDKFERLALESQAAAAILGNGHEFEIIDLGKPEAMPSSEYRRKLLERGFRFVGIVGLIEGRPKTALAEPLDEISTAALSRAYVDLIEQRINESAKAVGDGTDWLTSLYQLPDTREN
jgi:hypothetical protein